MKQKSILFSVLFLALILPLPASAQIPIIDIIKAATKKVIKQIDLKVQKMQNKTIALQNAQKTLENAMAKSRLKEITGWMDRQRKLYDEYYEELRKVKSAISTFQSVRKVVAQQETILSEYKNAYGQLRLDKNFSAKEVDYMYQVYTGIISRSVRNLDQLFIVINSYQTQMTDGERLQHIASVASQMQQTLDDLRKFSRHNAILSLQRAKGQSDINQVRWLYGITQNPKP
jgi:hypothetical protein